MIIKWIVFDDGIVGVVCVLCKGGGVNEMWWMLIGLCVFICLLDLFVIKE